MAIINVTPTGQTIKCKTDDVIILEGIETIKHNGFEVKYLHSETQSAFYVSPLGGKYIVGDKYFILEVSGETSEDHDLYEILGVTNRSEIDKVVWRDTKDFGGGTGSNFDPTKYYTKSVSDGRFQPLGDYATKTELNTKENKGVAYSKAESDGKYALKGEGGSTIDAYTKTESNDKFTDKEEFNSFAGTVYSKSETDDKYATKSTTYTKAQTDTAISDGIGTLPTALDNKANKNDVYTILEVDNKFALKSDAQSDSNIYKDLKVGGNFILGDFNKISKANSIGKGKYYAGESQTDFKKYYYEVTEYNGDIKSLKMICHSPNAPLDPSYIKYFDNQGHGSSVNPTSWIEYLKVWDSHVTYRKGITLSSGFINGDSVDLAYDGTHPNRTIETGRMMYRKGQRVSFNVDIIASAPQSPQFVFGVVPPEMRPHSNKHLMGRITDRYYSTKETVAFTFQPDGNIYCYGTVASGDRIIIDTSYILESHDIKDF